VGEWGNLLAQGLCSPEASISPPPKKIEMSLRTSKAANNEQVSDF